MILFTDRKRLDEAEERGKFALPSKEQINSGEGMFPLYRVAFSNQVDSLSKYGYNRAFTGLRGGNLYGPGVYCTFNLNDTVYNWKTKPEYGNCIIQMRLAGGLNGFIIFNERLARQTYGERWKIEKQLANVAGFSEGQIRKFCSMCYNNGEHMYHGRTAGAALALWRNYRENIFQQHGVRGIVYTGNRDGNCCLPYDFSSVIPYAVSYDGAKTWKRIFNDELYDFLSNHVDTNFRFGGMYDEILGDVMGFSVVKKGGNYNIVQNDTGNEVSPYWFDDVDGLIDHETGKFGFTYKGYHMTGSISSQYTNGTNVLGCILDRYGDPRFLFDDLDDIVDEIKERGADSYDQMVDMLDDEEMEKMEEGIIRKETLMRVARMMVNESIDEDRTVDGDGVVTIDNFDDVYRLMDAQSPDDVWFVQIVKRHKDNMDQHFEHNACEYVTSYLVHDANELDSKREEIKSVCRATNSRAYMMLNKRSLVKLTDYANNVLKPRFQKYKQYRYMGHEMEVAAGQSKDWDDRKMCFLDVDSDDENVYRKVMKLLSDAGITPVWEYRSLNNGWHILLPDKEEAKKVDFTSIDNGNNFGRFSTVGLEIDKPILLYASLKPNGYGLQKRVQQHKLNRRFGSGGHRGGRRK